MEVDLDLPGVAVAGLKLVRVDGSEVMEATWAYAAYMVLALLLAAALPCALSFAAAPPAASYAINRRCNLCMSTISNYIFELDEAPFIQAQSNQRHPLGDDTGRVHIATELRAKKGVVWVLPHAWLQRQWRGLEQQPSGAFEP